MHPHALLAAKAAMAAHAQGQFWAYHDKLFANQNSLDAPQLLRYARELKLDMPRFQRDLHRNAVGQIIQRDLEFAAKRMKLPGAPFVFINGLPVSRSQDLETVAERAWQRAMRLMSQGVRGERLYQTLILGGKTRT
jgi:protein-disulfide isomerase